MQSFLIFLYIKYLGIDMLNVKDCILRITMLLVLFYKHLINIRHW